MSKDLTLDTECSGCFNTIGTCTCEQVWFNGFNK